MGLTHKLVRISTLGLVGDSPATKLRKAQMELAKQQAATSAENAKLIRQERKNIQ